MGLTGVAASAQASVTTPDIGPNVKVFDPSMPVSAIQATVDAIAAQQVDNEMGAARYALLFKPGTYGTAAQPLDFQVGYSTEVSGLGASPTDVTINGYVDVPTGASRLTTASPWTISGARCPTSPST